MYKRNKLVNITLALILVISSFLVQFAPAFAQEITPTDTPTPTPQTSTIDQNATTTNDATTIANTGDTTVGVTPTPTPEGPTGPSADISGVSGPTGSTGSTGDTPAPASGSATIDQTSTIINDASSSANTGGNDATVSGEPETTPTDSSGAGSTTSSSTPSPTPTTTVTTGTAITMTRVANTVNTTSVNSNVINQVINIYIDQNATLDLSDPATFIRNVISDHPTDATIDLHITQTSTLSNTVNSTANSGNNSVATTDNATLTTGDAYTLTSILNRVNFIAIDSVVHVVTINIFGTLNGDIILPSPPPQTESTSCDGCLNGLSVTDTSTINNTVTTDANTGNNSLTATTSGSITTGDATNAVTINNLVNTTLLGANVFGLYINLFGTWDGQFAGYGDITTTGSLVINQHQGEGGGGCCVSNLTATQSSTLTNTINSSANTGGNALTADAATITTGNAVNVVSLVNLVNTLLYRTHAFLGFINIFGSWHGNIGDAASLAKLEATPTPAVESQSSGPEVRESGGLLTITNTNNVGAYILPGDTVTFFIKVKNPGSGKVYGASIKLYLVKDGKFAGGKTFPIGDIEAGHGYKLTTGFVLSTSAPGGPYIARADVTGTTGPDNQALSATADSTFLMYGAAAGEGEGFVVVSGTAPDVQVLGATTVPRENPNILLALLVLLALVPEYIFYRATKNRQLFAFIITDNISWQARLRAVTMLLL